MHRNTNTMVDQANQAMDPALQATVSSPKFGNPGLHSSREFPQENLIKGSPRSPTANNWPLPASPDRVTAKPLSPGHINIPPPVHSRLSMRTASFESGDDRVLQQPRRISGPSEPPSQAFTKRKSVPNDPSPVMHTIPYRQSVTVEAYAGQQLSQSASISSVDVEKSTNAASHANRPNISHSRNISGGSVGSLEEISEHSALNRAWPYHRGSTAEQRINSRLGPPGTRVRSSKSASPPPPLPPLPHKNLSENSHSSKHLSLPRPKTSSASLPRPSSAYSSSSEHGIPVPPRSPQWSPNQYDRALSTASRRTPENRPRSSYIDLLNVPYPQPPPAATNLDNAHLRDAVGNNASLLSTKQTLDMYRANVKKTNDPTIQYEFAIFMVNTAQESINSQRENDKQKDGPEARRDVSPTTGSQAELLREARHILQRLADRSYPFAQYYLADGYSSGLFNKGVEDYDRAFPLFVAASKHGHAEAGYRAALCYEFGWGTRKDPLKAVQFFRQSASKNHPGAMTRLGKACMVGDLGLGSHHREGLKWLKRGAESADYQYNSAPYELGLLHETGFGDDIFQDQSYAAQLFTQSADLGHMEANFKLGDAYEHGKLGCPRDPALSVHFYTGAAQRDHPLAQMALCAWYMVGAEPVLVKNEIEACEWARRAAESGRLGTWLQQRTEANRALQGFPKLSMLWDTLQKWVSGAGAIRWRLTFGM